MSSFDLKSFDIFQPTAGGKSNEKIHMIDVKNLYEYKDHKFKLYEGERLNDMVESIRTNGIIIPIIVRSLNDFDYEILSGHNRFNAGKIVGLNEFPCVIKTDLADEEARLIVTETNLMQRSFTDLSHSERAEIIVSHYDAIKSQGKRSDLILEVENILKNTLECSNSKENSTCTQIGYKLKSGEKLGERYGLSKNTVARYLRVYELIKNLKELLDEKKIGLMVGVELSFLGKEEQELVFDFLTENNLRVDIKKAEQIRKLSKDKNLSEDTIKDLFWSKKKVNVRKKKVLNLERKRFEKYFSDTDTEEEIEKKILEALEFYAEFKENEE